MSELLIERAEKRLGPGVLSVVQTDLAPYPPTDRRTHRRPHVDVESVNSIPFRQETVAGGVLHSGRPLAWACGPVLGQPRPAGGRARSTSCAALADFR